MSLSRLLCCVGIVHEAYASFKTNIHTDSVCIDSVECGGVVVNAPSNVTTGGSPNSHQRRVDRLKFWLMFGIYVYAEPWADATIGRLPLYGLMKLVLTSALIAPHSSIRQFLYSRLRPYLVSIDASFQLHSTRAIRHGSFTLHRTLLHIVNYCLRQTIDYLSDDDLTVIEQCSSEVLRQTKLEKIQRLKASMEGMEWITNGNIIKQQEQTGRLGCEESPKMTANEVIMEVSEEMESESFCLNDGTNDENVDPTQSHPPELSSPIRLPTSHHHRTPSSHGVGPSTPSKGSTLSHRLGILQSDGNSISMLRERTHTPQKTKLWQDRDTSDTTITTTTTMATASDAHDSINMKKKRQTMGL